jgi:hypothetical protein
MRSGFHAAAAGGVAALSVFGLVACGSGNGGAQPGGTHSAAAGQSGADQAVQAAYRSTAGEKSAVFRIDETINAAGASGSAENAAITGTGQADLASHAFALTMNVPVGGPVRMLESGGIEYVQVPAAQRGQVPGHKPWESVNINKVSEARLGTSLSQLSSAGTSDPAQALSQLSAVSSQVSKAGTATVAGVPVTGYRAQVSLSKLASQMQAKAGPQAAQAIRQEEQKLGASLPVQVWVDSSHLVRQIRFQVPLPSASGASGSGTATSTMTFTSFGGPVTITPPPASEVSDITSQVLQRSKAASG